MQSEHPDSVRLELPWGPRGGMQVSNASPEIATACRWQSPNRGAGWERRMGADSQQLESKNKARCCAVPFEEAKVE